MYGKPHSINIIICFTDCRGTSWLHSLNLYDYLNSLFLLKWVAIVFWIIILKITPTIRLSCICRRRVDWTGERRYLSIIIPIAIVTRFFFVNVSRMFREFFKLILEIVKYCLKIALALVSNLKYTCSFFFKCWIRSRKYFLRKEYYCIFLMVDVKSVCRLRIALQRAALSLYYEYLTVDRVQSSDPVP